MRPQWRRFRVSLFLVFFLLAACAKDDPRAALDAAAGEFQAALEAKETGRVLDLLHPAFTVQGADDGRDWARRTMVSMFMRYKTVTIVVPWRRSELDSRVPDRAATEAEVTLLGAEGLLPESARHFRVRLEWGREGRAWKVTRLTWA
ncbi:MAG: hypothetical protein LBF91_06320 [Azoarcus sp.]|nr:hypothetical protein [Azoarcus sp.]